MMKKLFTPRNLCLSALIAAVYAVLTLALPVLSYGEWQCRIFRGADPAAHTAAPGDSRAGCGLPGFQSAQPRGGV